MTQDPPKIVQDANVTTDGSVDPWNLKDSPVWKPSRGWSEEIHQWKVNEASAMAEEIAKQPEFSRREVGHYVIAVEVSGTFQAAASVLEPTEYRIWLRLPPPQGNTSVGLRIEGSLHKIAEWTYEPISARLFFSSWDGWEPFLGTSHPEGDALLALARAAFRHPDPRNEEGK